MANQQAGWAAGRLRAVAAGLLWGLAYLAKPIALPWAVLVTVATILFDGWRNGAAWRKALFTGGVLTLVAAPWIGVISQKYGHWTMATTGPIAHALAGPAEVTRYHPTFVTLHHPEPGRITSWEDPTRLGYQRWAPFASVPNLRHQLQVVGLNSLRVVFILTTLVPVWPWILGRALRREDRESIVWRSLVPVGLLAGLYLPFYLTANEQRYFLVALPLFWGGWSACKPGDGSVNDEQRQTSRLWLSVSLIALVTLASHVRFSYPPRMASRDARETALWLDARDLKGPVAGSALQRGGRTGLFLAWHLRQPWLGDDPSADSRVLVASGARLVALTPEDPRVGSLEGQPGVRRLELPRDLGDRVALFEVTRE
jgi:hypothetical protein